MTADPDDAELAAQALLEHMSKRPAPGPSLLGRGMNAIKRKRKSTEEVTTPLAHREGQGESLHGSAYYHALAARIRETQAVEARFAKRFVAYCEEQLAMPVIEAAEHMLLANLEQGLFERQHVVDREGGELKRRWQHCVADVTVRLMQSGPKL